MAKTNNIIELNGKQYDAITGSLVQSAPQSTSKVSVTSATPSKAHVIHRGVVDGILKQGSLSKTNLAPIPVKPAPATKPLKKTIEHATKPLAAHKPEHAKTLMRHVVKTPQVQKKTPLKVQVPTDLTKKQFAVLELKPKLSSELVDTDRAERAKQVPKSGAVDRFLKPSRAQIHVTATASTPRPYTRAVIRGGTDGVTRPRATRPATMFEKALANASSHEQVAPKESRQHKTRRQVRTHTKAFSISTAILVVLVLGGFIAYQNKASIQLQLASSKAGFHASMPSYKPSGFAMKGLSYSSGEVTLGFSSSNDNFNVVQKASNWDSQTLLENFVATSGEAYKTYQAAGRTVYVYDSGNATWVNGGVWYQIEGNTHLSSNQITSLAASM